MGIAYKYTVIRIEVADVLPTSVPCTSLPYTVCDGAGIVDVKL